MAEVSYYVEVKNPDVTFESSLDVKFLGQFLLSRMEPCEGIPSIAYMNNLIYVAYQGFRGVRVFIGVPPFNEYPPIPIEKMKVPRSMVACAARSVVYISDLSYANSCIWKLQKVSQVSSLKIKPRGTPEHLSITPKGDLLVVVERPILVENEESVEQLVPDISFRPPICHLCLEIMSLDTDSKLKVIPLPKEMAAIHCVVQLPSEVFTICYSKNTRYDETTHFVSLLSSDGKNLIWTLDTTFFPSDSRTMSEPYYFTVTGEGYLFLSDKYSDFVVLLNPIWAEYSIISDVDPKYHSLEPTRIVYEKTDRRLLVQNRKHADPKKKPFYYHPVIAVFVVSQLKIKTAGDQLVPEATPHTSNSPDNGEVPDME